MRRGSQNEPEQSSHPPHQTDKRQATPTPRHATLLNLEKGSTTLKATDTPETTGNPLKSPQPSPEEKTRLMMEMTEAVTAICADGIKAENPGISEEEVITELRIRITHERRT